jgi:ATP synthase protein I
MTEQVKTGSRDAWADADAAPAPVKPLSREQAQALIAAQPKTLALGWVVVAQVAVGLVAALLAWLATGRVLAVWSALGGALIAAVPSALMLYGVTRSALRHMVLGPLVWLVVKLAASLVMFMLVIRALGRPDWPVLLITLIVALKMYWLAVIGARGTAKDGEHKKLN